MRRLLGLPVMIALASLPAWAEPTREEVMAGAERCDGIADNRMWLECFYGSAQPMRSLLNLPPASPAQVRLVPPRGAEPRRAASARAPTQEAGGFWSGLIGNTGLEASNVAMTRYEFDRSGAVTVSLADGQVWRQLSSDMARAKWKAPAGSYRVDIGAGLGDTFDLRVRGEKGSVYRMRRVTARR